MSKFQSFLAHDMEAFRTFQKASGRWNGTYDGNLRYYDRHLSQFYPYDKMLTQEMVDIWCTQRATERNNSCIARINVVSGFIRYLRERGKTDVASPAFPIKERQTYIPHAFTASELESFFQICDSLPSSHKPVAQLRKIAIPVFFRLLYSSGIRTCEARMLQVDDVDLNQGVLSIRHSKGESQHYVVLHETMLDLLKKYDAAIRLMYPMRKYFFYSICGSHYSRDWAVSNFRKLWSACNTSHATAHELRHHYATENINQWIGHGFDFDSKLLYLSKSMGHSTIESTKYYYSLVPALANIMEDLSGHDFDDIVPEVDDDEIQ